MAFLFGLTHQSSQCSEIFRMIWVFTRRMIILIILVQAKACILISHVSQLCSIKNMPCGIPIYLEKDTSIYLAEHIYVKSFCDLPALIEQDCICSRISGPHWDNNICFICESFLDWPLIPFDLLEMILLGCGNCVCGII